MLPFRCQTLVVSGLLLALSLSRIASAQTADSTQAIRGFSGKVFLTNNGISLVPSFSLDKPALLFNLSLGGQRLTFEPDIRFSLAGKPWSMLFWWRYKAVRRDRFSLRMGVHPGFNFRTIPAVSNGKFKEVIETRRFLASEVVPNFTLTKNISVGAYYLYSLGLDDSQRHTHFLVFNTGFTDINLVEDVRLSVFPNVYYLRLDDLEGYYFSSTFRFSKGSFPLSLESIINKIITSQILPERDFVWNISLVYSFNKRYVKFQPEY